MRKLRSPDARAQTAIARKAVDDTIIKAPFAGYISARPVAVGQYVALTAKIATLVRVTPLKLELQVPGVERAAVENGRRCRG